MWDEKRAVFLLNDVFKKKKCMMKGVGDLFSNAMNQEQGNIKC